MKKKFWRKFQVLNCEYKVYKVVALMETGSQGICDPRAKVIVIDASLKGLEFNRTLMHELFHAHQCESGLTEVLDRQAMEMAAESLAGFICSILKVNFK